MILIPKIRQRLGWLTHCYKAVVLRYHHQLLPIFDLIVKPDDLVIDVGAHVGQFSKIFSKRTPKGLVLALEPASYPLSILRIVKYLHRLGSLKIIHMGVGVRQGEAILQTPVKNNGVLRIGLSKINNDDADKATESVVSETISITTIDVLTKQFARDGHFALLKADIEGYEYEMLCGAEQSIEKSKPCLLMEISINREEIMDFLWQRDYVIFGLLNYGGKIREPLRLSEIQKHSELQTRNILAVNTSKTKLLKKLNENLCKVL
jgi:FkbM family methyltransferase